MPKRETTLETLLKGWTKRCEKACIGQTGSIKPLTHFTVSIRIVQRKGGRHTPFLGIQTAVLFPHH
jgi:translation elongation factor EF-Tu-like GTPase